MPKENIPEKPLPLQMLDLVIGYWVSQLVYVAARLGLADKLEQGPIKVDDLAKQVDVNPRALYRTMRALASVGVFVEGDQGVFSLTPLAETLCSDRPESMRHFALMMVEGYNWTPWQNLHESVKDEKIAFDRVHGCPPSSTSVVDTVVAPGNQPQWGKLLDINMMVLTGGRERTEAEFAELFGKAELRLEAVHPTQCPLAVVEAVRA